VQSGTEPEGSPLGDLTLFQDEWRSLRAHHHNVLLMGPTPATAAVLSMFRPYLREPILQKEPGAPLRFPACGHGTMILPDVGALSADDQRSLMVWLGDLRMDRQVVSTTTTSLLPMVVRGLFDSMLYYRLNVLLLKVAGHELDLHRLHDAGEATSSSDVVTTH
jgi:hypothetical protein